MKTIELWTDGSCKNNGKAEAYGGWGVILVDKETAQVYRYCGREKNTTNNIMEMKAIINGLRIVDRYFGDQDISIQIFTDSAYVLNCYKENWYSNWIINDWKTANKTPVKNKELWQMLIPYFRDLRVSFTKVKGHIGIEYNEYVDTLAQNAANGIIGG